jgi:putative ABC transport system substrate-binding protein
VLYERATIYLDKILKGANPASLPDEQPSKLQVTVNNKTAQALGLSISPTLLAQVDEVIEQQGDFWFWHVSDIASLADGVRS